MYKISGVHVHRAEGNLGVLDVVVLPRVVRILRHRHGIPLLLCQNLEIQYSCSVMVGSYDESPKSKNSVVKWSK